MKIIFLFCFLFSSFSVQAFDEQDFSAWLKELKTEAKLEHISSKTIKNTFKKAQYLPQVIVLDRAQPEFISPFLNYVDKRVTPSKIAFGRAMMQQHAAILNQVETNYGVPKTVLVAFWAHRMHSYRPSSASRSTGDCIRSFSGSGSWLMT